MEFPGQELIKDPMLDLYYDIKIAAPPDDIWPWIQQLGYHRGGWYIDTWWNKFEEKYFWPAVVPKEDRGTYKPAANEILQEYQNIKKGDIIPDGPPGSAYYEVMEVQPNRLLLLWATSHFKYVAPQFLYRTRFAPSGAFCWAFIIDEIDQDNSRLISWWRVVGYPRAGFILLTPFLIFVDGIHQRAILRGVKKRVETAAKGDA
jgi:hypothetical protein